MIKTKNTEINSEQPIMCGETDLRNMCKCCLNSLYGEMASLKLDIKVKYVREGVKKITIIPNGDWIDLRAAEDVVLKKNEYQLIPLGVAIMLPKGYEAMIIPRSSTFIKYGIVLANSVALVDESYCGDNDEWMFLAYATRDIAIRKNTRICQFRIIKHQPELNFLEVTELNNPDRGGIGSTGED